MKIISRRSKLTKTIITLLIAAAVTQFSSCAEFSRANQPQTAPNKSPLDSSKLMPKLILWAWEKPENLEFLDADKFGVAFLAQTLTLSNDKINFNPRRQPLKVNPDLYLIAVTRIEAPKQSKAAAALNHFQQNEIVRRVLQTAAAPNVKAVQIDFDAAVSERDFYRGLLKKLRIALPAEKPLSITALASFCVGDRWLADLPVTEAVPMIFRMGADSGRIKEFLTNGNDFNEPLCRTSYGFALDEPFGFAAQPDRRQYFFNSRATGWQPADVAQLSARYLP